MDSCGGIFDEERDERLYRPLMLRGLLRLDEWPHPTLPDVDVVYYETTSLGMTALRAYEAALPPEIG